ncbi:AMP-binding protein [Mycobacterium sp. CVI_P3]|uniref:AMP-binding protein n=1 Tax=Mycobacterium pinniadriaticum TaxID=2994102 RepID=A0ABT3SPM8_9MYCO|nr:AMP-binding protein [Mycobacterium pinniadriaticum]MCX2934324.1 AMP-binding protein [Mycobacterium pinniadriaticum]MCX2940747.1 AMP-binding protein [Mycobacterium pinniadriaticum]
MSRATVRADVERAVNAYGVEADLYRAAGEWGDRTIVDVFRGHVAHRPTALAVATVEGALTYAELDRRSDALALGLIDAGLQPRDPVIFQMGNELESVIALYGALKAGLVPVCSIPNHRLHEVTQIAKATRARAHIFQADYRTYDLAALSAELQERCPDITVRVVARGDSSAGARSLDELVADADPERARRAVDDIQRRLRPDDVALFQLSGGTTGVPKVIPHTHNTYLSVAARWSRNFGWDEHTVTLHFLPVMHHAGLGTVLVPTHFAGGTVALGRSVDAELLVGLIERYRVSWMHFNMAAFKPLMEYSARVDCDFSSIKHFMWVFVRPEMSAQAEQMLGATAIGSFGMGEGVHLSALPDDPPEIRRYTAGSTIGKHDEVVVRQPGSEDPVPDGEVGELTFRGPSVIRSYLSDEHSATAFTSDGFLRSGDLGHVETIAGRRCYVIDGRLKDQISRGGEKVMAAELELLLHSHPEVREVAAIGLPDAALGERICVVVVPEDPGVDPEELRKRLVEDLDKRDVAKFKWPEHLVLVEQLPKTGVGKVQKDVLRSRVEST